MGLSLYLVKGPRGATGVFGLRGVKGDMVRSYSPRLRYNIRCFGVSLNILTSFSVWTVKSDWRVLIRPCRI